MATVNFENSFEMPLTLHSLEDFRLWTCSHDFNAGVQEYWLVDVRGQSTIFRIHRRGKSCFEEVEQEADGFQESEVLDSQFHLDRNWNDAGLWEYDLRAKR